MTSSLNLSSILQYLIILVVAYIFVGSPVSTLLGIGGNSDDNNIRRRAAYDDDVDVLPISPGKLKNLVIHDEDSIKDCPKHEYSVHIFSRSPLVVYIENFLSEAEREHLIDISGPLWTPSTVYHGPSNTSTLDRSIRHSHKAQPTRTQTVKCIESRARSFQGPRPHTFIEKLWTQRYSPGGHYSNHYDWGAASRSMGRVSSFMVYLNGEGDGQKDSGEKGLKGGGTRFPRLREVEEGDEWCRFVECGSGKGKDGDGQRGEDRESGGVTWKPIGGNAVYWENFDEEGRGYEESWHAGLPVETGEKYGLNIWSWYQKGFVPTAEQRELSKIADEGAEKGADVGEKADL